MIRHLFDKPIFVFSPSIPKLSKDPHSFAYGGADRCAAPLLDFTAEMQRHGQQDWQSFAPTSQDDEERQLQEALRLSAPAGAEGAVAAATGSKRKRDVTDSRLEISSKKPKSQLEPEYLNGGLRITRTPGRKRHDAKNTINLSDLIQKEHLVSACMFSFFIAEEEVFPLLPLSRKSNDVPVYVGRDANMDSTVAAACRQEGVTINGKISRKQLDALQPRLESINQDQYGKNYHSFYAWSSGSSHTKLLVLVYPDFMRVVITSCNMYVVSGST